MHEAPLYTVYPHPLAHLGGYVGLGLLGLVGLVAGFSVNGMIGVALVAACVLGIIMIEIVRRADRLAFYKDGIAREYRLLSTSRTFAEYDAIQDLDMNQGLLERAFGIGTLHINTSGGHGKEIIFKGVARCHEVEAALRQKMQPDQVDTPEAGNVR